MLFDEYLCEVGKAKKCPCENDSDCKIRQKCNSSVRICVSSLIPKYLLVNFNNKISCGDSECSVIRDETCKDGQCVKKYMYRDDQSKSRKFSWSGGRLVGIVLFGVVATIITITYYMCKRTRKPPNLPPRNVNLNAPQTGAVRVIGNDLEMQLGNAAAATNITVVEVENDAPLPPDAPPPYNSLEFENGQNENRNFPEQPPPRYDEAVRNPAVP